MYSLKYKVTTSTCDSEGRLKLYSALQMMQDCSEMWIDSEPVRVLRADIDYNRHMNNAIFVRIAMELLPADFKFSGLRVEYRVAAKLGDTLIPTMYQIEGGIIVSLMIGEEVSAIIEFTA